MSPENDDSQAEVTWQVRNNHGGGYSYRLCPADVLLSEECFQDHPLDFVANRSGAGAAKNLLLVRVLRQEADGGATEHTATGG